MRRSSAIVPLALLLLAAAAGPAAAQPAIFYVYDDLNRLIAVVDQDGNSASYTYDAVGNILRIERLDAPASPEPVAITLVSPGRGKVGTPVQVFGRGFAGAPGQASVAFNGVAAVVTAAAPNRLVTSVPPLASTGRLTVGSPSGSATSPRVFAVPGPITLDPPAATVPARRSQQFRASEAGQPFASVFWSVDGVLGGNSTVGTISAEGLYTAPEAVPSPPGVAVTATNMEDERLSATAAVTIVAPQDTLLVAPALTVQVDPGLAAERNIGAAVSVQVAPPLAVNGNVTTSVSVRLETAASAAVGAAVAVNVGPVVTSVLPSSGARATPGLVLRLEGAELVDVSAFRFLFNDVVDPAVVVTGLAIDPDGRGADLTISIATAATPGPRVVQAVGPAAVSTPVGTPGNRFTVQ